MASFLAVIRDIALLIVRVALGLLMVSYGWRHWQQLGIAQQISYYSQFSMPYVGVFAWANVILELVGGIFLMVGALTPLIALLVLVQQGLLIAYTTWYKGWWLVNLDGSYNGGYEYNALIAMVALLLMVYGAGRVAVDQLFRRTPGSDDDSYDSPGARTRTGA
jgi:putative oxidoreductase